MTPTCACCGPLQLAGNHSRRGFLAASAATVAGGLIGMTPFQTQAASGNYEAMLVNCIDPRFTTLSWQYMGLLQGIGREKLSDNYSQFVIAGGPIGAVHPKFSAWHKAYWDNLDITVSLHHIKRVVGITHRDCGAAKLAFGEDKVANKEIETESHAEALNEFRRQVQKRHPKLSVITGVMSLDGRVDLIG
ncbi:twin-arginine translocation signal domain-containing protein [Limnohabitans sp. TS-CS-82]|uniref:twin-arginine translocation signal domain-containing protein n=1 Tax=Limnohabitans sp. TS-CS-82 TaxID=2094193 RepID=UPI001F381AA6|nr:twin-arginine translocation signal domain-containing protein [Limnohabitans sp. TS-CS-82]